MFREIPDRSKLRQSQNFLHNTGLVAEVLKKTNINRDDIVIEIGPGKGIITWQLVRKCRKVYGIEYDFYLYEQLQRQFQSIDNIDIIHSDFLRYEFPERGPYKVFSNIPFNMTAEIVNKLVFGSKPPDDLYLFMQREAAMKYAGKPYNRECMRSVLIKPVFETEIIYFFKNTDFYPVPNINVVLIHFKKRQLPMIDSSQVRKYNDFIAYAFSRQGGSLKQRLSGIFTATQFKRLASNTGFDASCSPVDLNCKQWITLFDFYVQSVSKVKQNEVAGAYSKLMIQQSKLDKIHRNRRTVKRV